MKKYLPLILALLIITFGGATESYALSVFAPVQEGVNPTSNFVLQDVAGTSTWVATSTLGIIGGSGSPGGSSGQIQYNGSGSFAGVSTTTVSCSGSASCTPFVAIGSSPVTISASGTGGSGLATSSPVAASNLLVYSSVGAGSAYGVATSTLTASSPLTGSFTQIGSGGTLGIQQSSGSQAGYLSSTDWTTFNNKQSALTFSTGLNNSAGTITNTGVLSNIAGTGIGVSGATGNVTISNSGVISLTNGTGTTCSGTNPGSCNVNTTQNITTLSNLTVAGFVQTTSGGLLSSAALTSGQVTTALGFTPSSFAYPFPSNATSTLLTLSGGATVGGTFTLSALTGTQCLQEISGIVSGTGSACGSGGTGTNYFTNSGVNTYLNTGSNLEAPYFTATSTTATSSIPLLSVPTYLNVGGLPGYGYFPEDLVDVWNTSTGNDLTAVNVGSAQTGSCAQALYAMNGDNLTLNQDFTTISNTNTGYTGGGCTIISPTNVNPESTYIYQPTWDLDMVLGTTTQTVKGVPVGFKWLTGTGTSQAMVLTNAGKLGVGTTTPFAYLSVEDDIPGLPAGQIIFAVASSTGSGATTTLLSVVANGTSGTLNSPGIINLSSAPGISSIQFGGATKITMSGASTAFSQVANTSASTGTFIFNAPGQTGLTTVAQQQVMALNFNQVVTHNTGATSEFDALIMQAPINTFAVGTPAASVISTTSMMDINGLPNIGARGSQVNAYGLLIQATTTLTAASTTNSYGLGVFASSGATNNYSAILVGRLLAPGIGTGAGSGAVCYNSTTGEELFDSGANCITSTEHAKHDIVPVTQAQIQEFFKLVPIMATYNDGSGTRFGFIAEQVAAIDPKLVIYAQEDTAVTGPDGKPYIIKKGQPLSVDYSRMMGLAAAVIDYEQTEIEQKQGISNPYISGLMIAVVLLVLWNLYLTFKKK